MILGQKERSDLLVKNVLTKKIEPSKKSSIPTARKIRWGSA